MLEIHRGLVMASGHLRNSQSEDRLTRHLAAHTVAALRAQLRVELVVLSGMTRHCVEDPWLSHGRVSDP
jgi:hypothetical protein